MQHPQLNTPEILPHIVLGPDQVLTADHVWKVAHTATEVGFSDKALGAVTRSRMIVEHFVRHGVVAYGITTGFGNFKDRIISSSDTTALQRNLVRSHACGVGPLFSVPEVRAMMLVRLQSLAQGYSGMRMQVLELGVEMLNRGVIPCVPSKGSVGSSGDLAPLSHIGLVLMGEGEAMVGGKILGGRDALAAAGLTSISFEAKEGLAWTNGTSIMTGLAALAMYRCRRLLTLADIACSLSMEALCGCADALDPRIHEVRRHPGQQESAAFLRKLLQGSGLLDTDGTRVQDGYSLRCAPQVHGAVRDVIGFVSSVVERELNAVTDNPLIFDEMRALSGGNFHGEPVALAMDSCAIAISDLGNISERRTARMLDTSTSEGLPLFLVPEQKAGLHSGFMIPQYVAAALVSENKVLAHPASVDSIPTSANQEDHVSMGTIAARKMHDVLTNVETVLSIELMTAAQALEFRGTQRLGQGTKAAYKAVRQHVAPFLEDRVLSKDIQRLQEHLDEILLRTMGAIDMHEATEKVSYVP
jgi:histidine ammonia-lyase